MEPFRAAFRDELDVGTVVGVTAVFLAFYAIADLSTLAVVGSGWSGSRRSSSASPRTTSVVRQRGYPDAVTGDKKRTFQYLWSLGGRPRSS